MAASALSVRLDVAPVPDPTLPWAPNSMRLEVTATSAPGILPVGTYLNVVPDWPYTMTRPAWSGHMTPAQVYTALSNAPPSEPCGPSPLGKSIHEILEEGWADDAEPSDDE
jgi:hypothetical protein